MSFPKIKIISSYLLLLIAVLIVNSCRKETQINERTGSETKQEKNMGIKIKSSAFEEGGMIPKKYSCDGENISPPLSWSDFPNETKTFAIICDDPDAPAGTWVHWVVYNIPGDSKELPESIPSKQNLDNGAAQGINDFRKIGYGGPCPPGGTHRYFFKVHALDTSLNPQGDVTKNRLLDLMSGHILAEGQLMGKYGR